MNRLEGCRNFLKLKVLKKNPYKNYLELVKEELIDCSRIEVLLWEIVMPLAGI